MRRRWPFVAGAFALFVAAVVVVYFTFGQRPGDVSNPNVEFTNPSHSPKTAKARHSKHGKLFAWPIYGYDLQRTHYLPTPRNLVKPPFKPIWGHGGTTLMEFQPVLANRRLFFLRNDGTAYALNARTGRRLWKKKVGSLAASSPAWWKDRVFVTVLSGKIAALSAEDGHVLWAKRLPSRTESPPLVLKGRLYFGSESGTVYALRASDGRTIWTYKASGDVTAGPAYSNGLLYFGDYGGNVQAVRASNGSRVWRTHEAGLPFGRSGGFYGTPAVAFGRVYVGNLDRKVYSFSARSGKLAWSHSTGGYVYAAPAVADVPGTRPSVYVGSYDHNFYALDAQTGAVRWTYHASGPISGAATVIGRIVYFGTLQTHTTIGLDVRNGRRVFVFNHGAYNPAMSDGQRLYITGFSSEFALEPRHLPGRPRERRKGRPVQVRSHTIGVRADRVLISVRCPVDARGGCRGRFKVRTGAGPTRFLGRARFAAAPGRVARVAVHISRIGIERLHHSHRHRQAAVLYVIAADRGGRVRSARGRVMLTLVKATGRR
jgi:outer membrane protein assembly factor BamB